MTAANVLLFKGVKAKKGYKVEYNSAVIDVFKVTTAIHFQNCIPSSKGLYYANFSKDFNYIVSGLKHVWFAGSDYDNIKRYAHEHTVLCINIVEANKSKLSKQDVIWAEAAQNKLNTSQVT